MRAHGKTRQVTVMMTCNASWALVGFLSFPLPSITDAITHCILSFCVYPPFFRFGTMHSLVLTGQLPTEFGMREELTPAFSTHLAAEEGDRVINRDEKQPGLGLVVTKRSHKSCCVRYSNHAGKTRRMSPPRRAISHWTERGHGRIARSAPS
jgi:hypothetical protein